PASSTSKTTATHRSTSAAPTSCTATSTAAVIMHRNLDRRVEALVRLDNPAHIAETSELFDLAMDPGTSAWHLEPDGDWVRHDRDAAGEPLVDLQDERWRQVSSRRRPVGAR